MKKSELQEIANVMRVWIAMDKDGEWNFFDDQPRIVDGTFACPSCESYRGLMSIRGDQGWVKNWKESLIEPELLSYQSKLLDNIKRHVLDFVERYKLDD